MLTITDNAAEELKLNLSNPDNKGLYIRFAVDNSKEQWQYFLGFDDLSPSDIHLKDNGVEYIVAYEHKDLLQGATVDYDQINQDIGYGFIFLNPNDVNFVKPTED